METEEIARYSAERREEPVHIACIDYSPDHFEQYQVDPAKLDQFLTGARPDWASVRWINVDGLHDTTVIQVLAKWYRLHPLAIEDLLYVPQRPKVEPYPADGRYQARLFIVSRMIQWLNDSPSSEQVSIFLGHHTVLTFQQTHGDIWDPIRHRLKAAGSKLRTNDASFLVYALIDATVDFFFPILERYGERLEELEQQILLDPREDLLQGVHHIRRELLLLRREIWPLREMIQALQHGTHEGLSDTTRLYLRDVYDHAVQIIDFIETAREMSASLADAYLTGVSNRMNEVMKVLTIIATIFIPISFLAGVFGMNFNDMPGLEWRYGYVAFWVICIVVAGGLLFYFRRRKWI
jgi:magnesium transporter